MRKNCTETARLLSESRDRRLSLRERIHLRFHMMMCRMCSIYGHQLTALTRICGEASERATDCCPGRLPEERKARIRDAMKD
ncbi:MAG TPA: zf-HC2 domain-containing protein [Candidatus Krumholzibacteria bacterium]|nr:zf-HC2 domain-containing protein [Candidatus Krumholzibacteria bacterium]